MVRAALGIFHLVLVTMVGVATFLAPTTAPGGLALQGAAYALICVGFVAWLLADLSAALPSALTHRAQALLPYSLGLIVVAGSLGGTAQGGGEYLIAASAIAMLAAATELGLTAALAVAALGMLAVESGGLAFDHNIGTLLGLPALLFGELLIGRYRSIYRIQAEQAKALLEQHERLRAEQRRADVLDERTRIAREIHDVLAHSLGALGIQIQAARAVLEDYGDIERAIDTLVSAQRMAADGLTETRRAVHALRSDMRPLHEELAAAAREHADRHRVVVRCETVGQPRALTPEVTVALVRTAQESLINAAKHAPGQPIGIDLRYDEDGVRMTVVNDLADAASPAGGVPIPQTINGGYGLTGMRERLRLLRGTLDTRVVDGRRWMVSAELPQP
jgi:signal transduction histidine kinase